MAKYCKFCGNPIEDGKKCSCEMSQSSKEKNGEKVSDVKSKIEENMGIPNKKGREEAFEKEKNIVPDCIAANEGEIPIRQYNIAKLRTIIKGAFAEGKLQVTNKRVMFRSSGFSLLGPNKMQYEFAINEIAGIEIRSDHRLGIFHLFVAWLLFMFLSSTIGGMFKEFAGFSSFLAGVFSLILFGWTVLFFFSVKGKHYIKLIFNSLAVGALSTQSVTTKFFVIPVLKANLFGWMEAACLILLIFNFVLIAYVPNLVLEIKTKGANSPIEIRRKESNGILAFMFNMPKKEYTGYSDVMPGEDTATAMKELGALINDINMLGDAAIEKWRED